MSESFARQPVETQRDVVAEGLFDRHDGIGEFGVTVPNVCHRLLALEFGLFGGVLRECLSTPHAGVLFAGRFLFAPNADDHSKLEDTDE